MPEQTSLLNQPIIKPKIVLGIAAHPDDLDYSASGTMAFFASLGAKVHYLILTDGGQGTSDENITPEQLTKTRENEQKKALQILGGQTVQFLGYPDGNLKNTTELKKDIIKVIRTIRPDVVITMDPTVIYSAKRGMINHPDHRIAGQATLDCVYPLARDHLAYPELYAQGYIPHKTKTVLLTNFDTQNFIVDITKTINLKIAALKAHVSQIEDIEQTAKWIKENSSIIGKSHSYQYAEGFVRIDLRV